MHLDARQFFQNVRRVGQLRPVVLDVLAGGEMAITPVVATRDMSQHPQLLRIQRAIGNGDPEHVGVQLQVDTIHQAQRAKRIFCDLARQAAGYLIAELLHAGRNEGMVKFIVAVHGNPQAAMKAGSAKPWPSA